MKRRFTYAISVIVFATAFFVAFRLCSEETTTFAIITAISICVLGYGVGCLACRLIERSRFARAFTAALVAGFVWFYGFLWILDITNASSEPGGPEGFAYILSLTGNSGLLASSVAFLFGLGVGRQKQIDDRN